MRISSLYAQYLLQIAMDSLAISDSPASPFKFDNELRHDVVHEIMNQQDKRMVDLDTGKHVNED